MRVGIHPRSLGHKAGAKDLNYRPFEKMPVFRLCCQTESSPRSGGGLPTVHRLFLGKVLYLETFSTTLVFHGGKTVRLVTLAI